MDIKRLYTAPVADMATLACESGILGASSEPASIWTSGSIGGIDDGNKYSNSDFN